MPDITFYNNTFGSESVEVELLKIIKAIKTDKWKAIAEKYRSLSGDQASEYKKKKVPGLTVSGSFPKERKAKQIGAHSGFIAMDFDGVENIDDARAELYADNYTYAGFVSIGGSGLCLIVKIDPKKHIDAFRGLEHYYYTKYGYQIDQSCKDVSRLRYVSYDPDLYHNPDSEKFATYLKKKSGRQPKVKNVASTDDDVDYVLKQIEARKIDMTQDYNDWIELGFAIHSKYGDSPAGVEYFQRLSQFHPDYDPDKCDKKYKSFGTGGSGVNISTFFHHAKHAGCDIVTPKTKTIQTVAKWAKKGRRTKEDAVKQLEKIDGIPEQQSKEIVDQVFAGKVEVSDDSEDTVFLVEEFLRRERVIKFNEITLKYQEEGKPLNDRDFNSIYLDAKKVIPKLQKDLILACIDSDRTQTINPIKEFFQTNKSNTKSAIRELADSIKTPTGFKAENFSPDYCYHFIRKWMIGSVAMWYKHHSPLMLVLAGEKQNTGKSHFFRYLLPNELQPYYAEAELTGDKDENLLMCNKILIMNDEMSNKSRRDITMVKKLCSAKWFNLRKPYGKLSEDFRRIASLAGTSNSIEILSDPTGNRRMIPIEVDAIDHDKYNAIDKKDLWIEAYRAYRDGEQWELKQNDIDMLNTNTEEFNEASPEAELVMKFFKQPKNGDFKQQLTATEIKSFCEVRTQQKLSLKKLGMELKRLGFKQELIRDEGVKKRVYNVVGTEGENEQVSVF